MNNRPSESEPVSCTGPASCTGSSKLHADHYADQLVQLQSPLVQNRQIAESTFQCRVDAPEIAAEVLPGQFIMMRMSGHDAPLIGRALAVWDVIAGEDGAPRYIDLIYLKKGTLTSALAPAPTGTSVTLWGPLGNGFSKRPCDRLIMTAGGIGQTPMLMLGKSALNEGWADSVQIIYGARRSSLLAGVDDFRAAGFNVTLCSDDGSIGQRARVPDVLSQQLASRDPSGIRVVTCGPEIMMQKVSEVCAAAGIDCQVSMETPMACGIGICFSCVAKVRQEGEVPWDYKRTCVEGPIFDAEKIYWDD